jgi:hypothetical protein
MSDYYLNAGSSSPTGLTPEQGAHDFNGLLGLVPEITDGDTVYYVAEGGIIDEVSGGVTIRKQLYLRKYPASITKPIWRLTAARSLIFIAWFECSDIHFKSASDDPALFTTIIVDPFITLSLCNFNRCYFDRCCVQVTEDY